MQIIRDFTRLHSGENRSKRLKFRVNEAFYGKKAKLGFITPRGNIYFTRELSSENGEGEFLIPSALLDGKGLLLCQLFLWDEEGFMEKSPIEEIPVYPSVDDTDCPVITDEARKNLSLLFEYIEDKADIGHTHDERYYTRSHIDSILDGGYGEVHNHDGRYYTEAEVDGLLGGKSDEGHTHAYSPEGHGHTYSELTEKPRISGTELGTATRMTDFMFRRVLTASDDCDSIFEDGWYVYSTSSVPKNAPFPNASVIEVFGVDSNSTQKIQRAYRYGAPGYSAFRPLYSSKWAAWYYPLVTDSSGNSPVSDYVVEQGVSGKWTYRKWASGVAECWGTVTLTLSKDAYVWDGNIYCASGYGGSVLPSVFSSYTCVSIDPIYWYQIGGSGRVTSGGTLEANIFGKTTSMSSLKKDGQIDINCIIKGRWK